MQSAHINSVNKKFDLKTVFTIQAVLCIIKHNAEIVLSTSYLCSLCKRK